MAGCDFGYARDSSPHALAVDQYDVVTNLYKGDSESFGSKEFVSFSTILSVFNLARAYDNDFEKIVKRLTFLQTFFIIQIEETLF